MGNLVATAESKRFLKTACVFFSVAIIAGLAWLIFNNVKGGESSVRKADAVDYAGVDDGGYASRGNLDIPQTSEDEKSYVANGAAEVVDVISDNYNAIASNFNSTEIASTTNSETGSPVSDGSSSNSGSSSSGGNSSSNSGSNSGNNSESNNGSENNTGENNNENPGNNENLIDNGNSENSDSEEPEPGAPAIVPVPTEEPYITCGWDLTNCILEGEGVEEEDNVLYMQDIDEDVLDELPITESMNDIQWIEVVDRRTGEHYQVYKAYNRNGRGGDYALYMSTPLEIGSTEKPMLLTSEHTEIDDSFYILPVKHSSGLPTINEAIVDKIPESLTDGSDAIVRNTYESVCPKGWILPMEAEDYSLHEGFIQAETDFQSELIFMDSLNSIASSSLRRRSEGIVMHLSSGLSQALEDDQDQRVEVRCIYKQRPRRIYKRVTFDLNGGYAYNDNNERITSFVYSVGAYEGAENFILQSGYVNHYERYGIGGKVFRGWSDTRNGSAMVSPTSEFMLSPSTDPTTMYAVWADAQKPLYPSW